MSKESAKDFSRAFYPFLHADEREPRELMEELRGAGLPDFCLTVPTPSIHRIQETHVTLYHVMWDMVHTFLNHKSLVEEGAGI
jgi:hypothetical protein